MKLRNNKHVEKILDAISENFDLSVNEENIVESFLILLKDGDIKKLNSIMYLLDDSCTKLFNNLDKNDIKDYCERELDMVTRKYMDDVLRDNDELDFNHIGIYEAINICESKGYEVIEKESSSLIEDMQIEEMKELFLNLSFAEKEDVLNKIKNEIL